MKHKSGLLSVYAHNMKNLVKKGDAVNQGQVIGYVGDTGNVAGPHLHFEVRRGASPKNPLLFSRLIISPTKIVLSTLSYIDLGGWPF